jgi:hypothetical protein
MLEAREAANGLEPDLDKLWNRKHSGMKEYDLVQKRNAFR